MSFGIPGVSLAVGTQLHTTPQGPGPSQAQSFQLAAGAISDLLGRTGLISTSVDNAPAVASMVSVMDAPWGAKFDAQVVTDGSITSGTNQLSSPTATFKVGQAVVVLGAGPNVSPGGVGTPTPGYVSAFVSAVNATTGVASLVTTAGGSTPANATNTIIGTATVKYGTDDTAAIQTALNAVSATASLLGVGGTAGKIMFPENRATMCGNVTAANNVIVWMYGSTVHLTTPAGSFNRTSPLFAPGINTSVTNWHLRGGNFPGTGVEGGSQGIMYWNTAGFGQNGTATYTDISVKDAIVTNWSNGVWDVRGASRVRFSNNTCHTCSTFAGTNTINVIMATSGGLNSQDAMIQNNYFDGNGAECCAIGEASAVTGAFDRGIITGNTFRNTGPASCIDIEWSTVTSGTCKTVIIANNVIQNTGSGGGSAYGIVASSTNMPANANPQSRVIIALNEIDAADSGISCNFNDALVACNIINAGSVANSAIIASSVTALSITADTNQATTPTLLTNVVVNGGGVAVNGMQILSGPGGIVGGTYLVSGAGTPNWTISVGATTTTPGVAVTALVPVNRMNIFYNLIHVPSTAAHPPINATGLRDSTISYNQIMWDPGGAVAGQVGNGILLSRCGWCDVEHNRVANASTNGIQFDSCNDCHPRWNRIYNPSQNSVGGAAGITFGQISGNPPRIEGNIIIDDQATHRMVNAVQLGTNMNAAPQLIDNDMRGATSSPTTPVGTFSLIRGNTTDITTFPAATFSVAATGSVFTTPTVPYPCMVALNGGTVTLVQHVRPGSSNRNLSSGTNCQAYLQPGDAIAVTYSVAPTISVFPMM